MAINCLAPGYIKLFYSSNAHDHVQTLPVKPASVAADFHVLTKDNTNITIDAAIADFYVVWAPFFFTDDALTGFEQYTQADCASAPVFRGAGTLTGFPGTSGGGATPWAQADFTFKSQGGGKGIFKLLEPNVAVDVKQALNTFTGDRVADMRDWLISNAAWITARDNTYLSRPINYVTKTNDALRRKFLNP
jgi:hypothetical protein